LIDFNTHKPKFSPYLEKLYNSDKPLIIYKVNDGYNLYTDFSKKIILTNNNINNFFNLFSKKEHKKETDLYIGFFGYEILCNLLNIKIKNQKKLRFYKGVFYKPETLIKIRKDIKVISSKKNQVFRKFFNKTKILSPFKLNINYQKYKKIFDLFSKKIRQGETYQIKIATTNAKDQSNLYNVLVDLGRQLGLKSKKTPDDKLWLPSTGLSISEVFNRILYIIEKNKLNTVFVIDEIDHLAKLVDKTGKDVLYSITRANLKLKNGSLSLIGISNDVRFKDELDPRVISTLSEEELVFPGYETNEIKEILEDRVPLAFEENSVSSGALNLCASMACREHGDARRAIKLLDVAAKTAELKQDSTITDEHIRLASQRIEVDKESQQLSAFSLHEKLLVIPIMKSPNISTGDVYAAYNSL